MSLMRQACGLWRDLHTNYCWVSARGPRILLWICSWQVLLYHWWLDSCVVRFLDVWMWSMWVGRSHHMPGSKPHTGVPWKWLGGDQIPSSRARCASDEAVERITFLSYQLLTWALNIYCNSFDLWLLFVGFVVVTDGSCHEWPCIFIFKNGFL